MKDWRVDAKKSNRKNLTSSSEVRTQKNLPWEEGGALQYIAVLAGEGDRVAMQLVSAFQKRFDGDLDSERLWLRTEHCALEGKKPLEYADGDRREILRALQADENNEVSVGSTT